MKKIALVAKHIHDMPLLNQQIKELNISNIDVVEAGSDVGFILDCGQNVKRLGLITDEFNPLSYDSDTKQIRQSLKQIAMPHLSLSEDTIIEANRESYDKAISDVLSDPRKYSEMNAKELSKIFDIEEDISSLIAIGMAFMLVVHCEPMTNKWGQDDFGYMAESYDKEKNKKVFKKVVGFYNASSLKWMTKEAVELFDNYKDRPELIDKFTKSFRTKIRSIVNGKKSIYAIKFFAEFLEKELLADEGEEIVFTDNKEYIYPKEDLFYYVYRTLSYGIVSHRDLSEEIKGGEEVESYEDYVKLGKTGIDLSFKLDISFEDYINFKNNVSQPVPNIHIDENDIPF